MATTTRQAPVLPAPSGRAGFGGTLRSEFTKIGSVRSTYWTLLMLLAVSVGIGAAISAVVAGGWSQPPPPPPAPPDIYDATQVSLAGMLDPRPARHRGARRAGAHAPSTPPG